MREKNRDREIEEQTQEEMKKGGGGGGGGSIKKKAYKITQSNKLAIRQNIRIQIKRRRRNIQKIK